MANLSIESVQVGWKTIIVSTIGANFGCIPAVNAIAPPRSYPNSIVLFFFVNSKILTNYNMKSIG